MSVFCGPFSFPNQHVLRGEKWIQVATVLNLPRQIILISGAFAASQQREKYDFRDIGE